MPNTTMRELVEARGGVTRGELVEAAKTWIGTPYVHRQRLKGVAADCIQFLIGVCEDLEIFPAWVDKEIGTTQYSTQWHLHNNEELLIKHVELIGLDEKPINQMRKGDLIGFQFGNATAHLGMVENKNFMIHAAMLPPAKVHRARLTLGWRKRITKCWSIPNVRDR